MELFKTVEIREKKNHSCKYLAVFHAISINLPANPYVLHKSGMMLLLFKDLFLGF